MIKYVYIVHSKLNEDLIRDEFETADEAIGYAEENKDQETSVEQVEVDVNDFGEVTDVGDSEIIYNTNEPELVEDDFVEDDYINDAMIEDELDADYQALADDIEYEEADELDTLEDQAMAEAEHPIDEAMNTKKDYCARLDELEANLEAMDEDVCKDYKVVTHSEDEVKDLKEGLDDEYEIKNVRGHYEVYKGNKFILSADTEDEAERELEKISSTNEEIDYDKLREELEENEDEVECQVCYDLVPKEDAIKTDEGYYICKHCAGLNEAVSSTSHKTNIDAYYEMIDDFVNFEVSKKALDDYSVESGDITPEERMKITNIEMELATAIDNWASQNYDDSFAIEEDLNNASAPQVGDSVRIISMEGEPNYTGRTGIIKFIDDAGQLHGTWGGLAIVPEKDKFEII